MLYKIIKTENYLLLVSDEVITSKAQYVDLSDDVLLYVNKAKEPMSKTLFPECKLVIAHLPLNGVEELEGVPLLPKIVDMTPYDLGITYASSQGHPDPAGYSEEQIGLLHGFIDGYDKAKETYKYTEEDLREAISEACLSCEEYITDSETFRELFSRIIQSIQKPKYPIAFECNLVDSKTVLKHEFDGTNDGEITWVKEIETTTNSQGKTELVGTYIWE